jgi:hypothetical protein
MVRAILYPGFHSFIKPSILFTWSILFFKLIIFWFAWCAKPMVFQQHWPHLNPFFTINLDGTSKLRYHFSRSILYNWSLLELTLPSAGSVSVDFQVDQSLYSLKLAARIYCVYKHGILVYRKFKFFCPTNRSVSSQPKSGLVMFCIHRPLIGHCLAV